MKAAVVHSFGVPPSFAEFREPEAGHNETVVQVHAAPLSPIVKRLASGTHYASDNSAGFVPGVDGVGVDSAGRRVYFLFPKAPFGSMAEKSLVLDEMTVPVPESLSDVQAAAIATAGLASWIALTRRAKLQQGETVLVNGATGSAGAMALQTARYLGATGVIAVGRNGAKLERLELMGSGIGSVSIKDLLTGAGELLAAAPAAGFHAPVTSLPLEAVAEAWNGNPDVRYILTP